jgi:hypothetical protein
VLRRFKIFNLQRLLGWHWHPKEDWARERFLKRWKESLVIDAWYEDGALFKILIALCIRQTLLADDDLVEKESLGDGEADDKPTQIGHVGKVGQDVDEAKGMAVTFHSGMDRNA